MRDSELQARANAYAVDALRVELGYLMSLAAEGDPRYKRAKTAIARAFVIGFAAGVESSRLDVRTSDTSAVRVRRPK